jgi:hypothetical protein
MEHPTEFDLNAAIERWQEGLRRSAQFSAEDVEELRTHLRDSVSKLSSAGLNEAEAFQIATQRIGSQKALASEFSKQGKPSIWRKPLSRYRPHFLIINLVMSALVTPDGDPLKMVLLAVPIQVLFEIILWVARDWGQWAKLFNNAVHGLIVILFALACLSLFGMLNVIESASARVLGGPPPAFTSLCLAWRPALLVLPVLAALYCWLVWARSERDRRSWVPFFAATTATLVLITFPTLLSVWLPVVVFMERMAPK